MMERDEMNIAIGNALRKARKGKRISQYKLSDLTGIARSTITRYELGDIEISMHNFIKICDAIGVDYATLLQNVPVPR